MEQKSVNLMVVVFLSMALCFAYAQPSHSATVVTVEPGGSFVNIGAFNFTILSPAGTSGSSFNETLPVSWVSLPAGSVFSAFDGATNAPGDPWQPLPSGPIGSFTIDVILGNWSFGPETAGQSFIEGIDYFVTQVGTNYTVSAVPIPAAVWLLGSGVVGLVVLKRRKKA